MMLAHKAHQTSPRTILCDYIAMGLALVDVIALDDIGMVNHLKDLNLTLEQLHRRRGGLAQPNDFNGIRLAIRCYPICPIHRISLVHLTRVSSSNLITFVIIVSADLFGLLGLVSAQTDRALNML